ncbi:MAG: hypothetical protein LAQ30_11995 [Acidobacteriia bacterium]|nr:hypothetical protein [Terriglobia bacterium]
MKIALIGFGNVGRALARLLSRKRAEFPFTIAGIHTLRHGTAVGEGVTPVLEGKTGGTTHPTSIEEFLDAARADIAVELTTLDPSTGEPAISHIRAAFARGAPVFNIWRHAMPGVKVLGFTGALNSTSKVVIETMERGGSFADGLSAARAMGITEADGAFDVEGWDSAAKTAALANVLLGARTTPQRVSTRGIGNLTPERVAEIARNGKTVRLVSRGRRTASGVSLRVRAEVLDRCDPLASLPGTSNIILFHTDLMGTFGTVSIEPTVEQTAYGVFSDLVDLPRR